MSHHYLCNATVATMTEWETSNNLLIPLATRSVCRLASLTFWNCSLAENWHGAVSTPSSLILSFNY